MTGLKSTDKVQTTDQPLKMAKMLAAANTVFLVHSRLGILAILLMFYLTDNWKILKREKRPRQFGFRKTLS